MLVKITEVIKSGALHVRPSTGTVVEDGKTDAEFLEAAEDARGDFVPCQ